MRIALLHTIKSPLFKKLPAALRRPHSYLSQKPFRKPQKNAAAAPWSKSPESVVSAQKETPRRKFLRGMPVFSI
ncbi:MAG: hypothetical protein IJ396_02210 [Oscillibacter sp.]|nr:hypothetical protein [Oscillibacter sp.]